MRYYWRVWQWENGHKGTEYTPHLTAPIFIEDRLDETLDTGEIILENMPIASKAAFPPKTKFRLERYLTADFTDTPRTWDFVVEHDDVEEYAGLSELCCHRIHLIEPSVIAQGMHVDNIALTYELQDVDLNYKVVKDDNTRVGDLYGKYNGKQQACAKNETITKDDASYTFRNRYGNFINAYKYEWDLDTLSGEKGLRNILLNHHAINSAKITFAIPKLFIWGSKSDVEWTDEPLFELNTVTRVYKILRFNGNIISKTEKAFSDASYVIFSGAKNISNRNDSYCVCENGNARLRKIEDFDTKAYRGDDSFSSLYTTFPIIASANSEFPNEASFSTDVLSATELEQGYTVDYEIVCTADYNYQDGMIGYYKQNFRSYMNATGGFSATEYSYSRTESLSKESATDIRIDTVIYCFDNSTGANSPFVRKGARYYCYDLLRKALLTCDTYLLNNNDASIDRSEDTGVKGLEFPIVISNDPKENWEWRLQTAKIYETVFEQKNLWEVLLQIGYYLHAIPRLGFATDGTDRFLLKFRQLGGNKKNDDKSSKLTIFNSRNLSEYFTQYDSYVTNLFSPQNLCEEWLTCKTSDSSYLVSNDNAELQTKYNITEIDLFNIIYEGIEKKALSVIFERSIYEILTNADPAQITPAKGNSIYYTLGSNKIQGLSYIAPSVNSGDKLMALKYIMQKLFGVSPSVWTQKYTFNDLRFHIRYRTQDFMRVTQFRPDLQNFLQNSNYEKYPHHDQFHGQQDKIIDSERFSANLFGKLIRVGNAVYQRQEYATSENEKESGDLVKLNREPYYVTAIENEYYPDAIFQKVTYSKNFNQLSNIVTIPSEPRFYEVSERSKIRREVRIQEFFALSTQDTKRDRLLNKPVFISSSAWGDFMKQLIFYKEQTLLNFAYTRFMADQHRKHKFANSGQAESDELFPSCDFIKTGENSISPVSSSDHADCIVPLLHYPLHDGIVFEWDMEDNFKAGDYIDEKVTGAGTSADSAYMAQQSLRYTDILGRADLFRFALFYKDKWTDEQAQKLPQAVIEPPTDSIIAVQGDEKNAIALDKDSREEISFNYQINLLHHAAEGDDDFITFPNLFGQKDNNLKVCLLNQRQSLFNENVDITDATTVAKDVPFSFDTSDKGSLTVNFGTPTYIDGANISQVKSIVFYQENKDYGRAAYIVKNVEKLDGKDKLQSWFIYPVFNGN